ncbi:MAG TPA: histidine kinase dimerization/phospho-acceptor domain-containing protein, partial [Cytophagales bacterium]|nr:histidine kinase dimerization/phospho-acceptor domain-containing protein [Cytophagales bacterium]
MELHKALLKQIDVHLPDHLKNDPSLGTFFKAINDTYHTYENDQRMALRGFEVSELEYQSVLNNLKKKDEVQQQAITRIKSLIMAMDKESSNKDVEEYDLDFAITHLERRVEEFKMLEIMAIDAINAAENSVRAKSNFLSVMSHEIRTPLNAIIGSIHILKKEEHLPSQEAYIQSLQISADNLLNLINDILDFNKIEEGKVIFAKQEINLRSLLNNIKLANYFKANERGNKLKIMFDEEIPNFVIGDETRLAQILNNLISNAIKFTSKGLVQIDVQ